MTTPSAPGDRFRRIEALFLKALDLPADQRATFLDRECPADDPVLRMEVEGMLATEDDAGAGDRLLDDVVAAGAAVALDGPDDTAPERIGPYRIVREIGRGGLATVYLAERDDEFSRRVAVKLIRRGLDTEEILQRLRLERRILAGLDHPNIARLYDGGTTEDGRPYFVMEAIEGAERLDVFCARRGLDLRTRLELFRKVCAAVHAAHRNLILHRDLKPSNILVTPEGEPKLLDFGIAKILDSPTDGADRSTLLGGLPLGGLPYDGLSFRSPTLTVPGSRLLTPDFASPEQMRAETLTTASDVYSLGVLLYLLITGQRPYEFNRARPAEAERVVSEVEPKRASRMARREPAGAAPGWRPPRGDDLDTVVAMALRKEPERRYGSAAELAEDLRRYLADLPVAARSDTAWYRTRKFVHRHRLGVAMAALIGALLVAATLLTSRQASVAREQRARAEEERARAEQVADFLVEVFEVSDPYETLGETLPARAILDRGARRIRGELAEAPELRATLLLTLGRVYRNLSLFGDAQRLLEEALAARRENLGEGDPEVATALRELAVLDLDRGLPEAARERLDEALAIQQAAPGARPTDVAETLHQLGRAAAGGGEIEAAEESFRRALDLFTELGDDDGRATVLDAEGEAWLGRDPARAEQLLRESLALRRRLHGDARPEVANALNNLAVARREQGDTEGAVALYGEALAIARRVFGDDSLLVGTTLTNLAWARFFQGDLDAAEGLFDEALEVRRKLYGEAHPSVAEVLLIRVRMEQTRGRLAREAGLETAADGRLAAAVGLARKAHEIFRDALGEYHLETLRALYVWADAARQQGDPAAETLFERNVEALRGRPEGRAGLVAALLGLGQTRLRDGRPATAETPLREALELLDPTAAGELGLVESVLGQCLAELGRLGEARDLLTSSIARLEQAYGPGNRLAHRAMEHLAELGEFPSSP